MVQNFSKDINKRTEGADDKVVIQTLMEQARVTISQNRGLYLEGIARVYASHLSEGELRAAVKFFSSDAGRKWTTVQGAITKDTLKYAATMGGSLKTQIVQFHCRKVEAARLQNQEELITLRANAEIPPDSPAARGTLKTLMTYDYDLFVIGAGSGGVRAARMASQLGAKVVVAEEYRVGGTCVIRGCVPKKLFVYASHFSESFEDAAGFGWTLSEATFDWPTLLANKDKEIDRLNGIYIRNLEAAGVEIVHERAVLKDSPAPCIWSVRTGT